MRFGRRSQRGTGTSIRSADTTRRVFGAVLVVTMGTTLGACGNDDGDDTTGGSILVSASSSLGTAMTEIAEAFEAEHEGVSVSVNIANSSALASQIEAGAPVDVFASADEWNMQSVVDGQGTVAPPVVFATNEPRILVGPGNPFGITGLDDLAALTAADSGFVYVAVAPESAIGRYVTEILQRAGVELSPRSFEESVTAAANKVRLGEADATIVFATDVLASGDRGLGVPIAPEVNVVATALIAVPAGAPNPDGATAFVDFVLGDTGQAILRSYGFGAP